MTEELKSANRRHSLRILKRNSKLLIRIIHSYNFVCLPNGPQMKRIGDPWSRIKIITIPKYNLSYTNFTPMFDFQLYYSYVGVSRYCTVV